MGASARHVGTSLEPFLAKGSFFGDVFHQRDANSIKGQSFEIGRKRTQRFAPWLWHGSCTWSGPIVPGDPPWDRRSKLHRRHKKKTGETRMLKKMSALFGAAAIAVALTGSPALAQQQTEKSEKQSTAQADKEKKESESKAASTAAGAEKQQSKSQEKQQPK
jgi:hypothetical protein